MTKDAGLAEKVDTIVMTTSEERLYASWIKLKFTQDFENYNYVGYGIGYDMDIEIYNKSVQGYNSNNIYSGTSSIHRIGKVPYSKRFTLSDSVSDKLQIGETYKITYYVRMGENKSTNGDIQFVPTNEYNYPAASDGDFFIDSVSLDEISDGSWYKVTKIMTVYNQYLAMRTPESSDLYFDNFSIEWVPADTILNENEELVRLGEKSPVFEQNNDIPKTGDDSSAIVFVYIALVCACMLILLSVTKKTIR